MARAGLGLGVRELAALADVAPGTITRLERGESLYPRTVETIRATLEGAGVEFIDGGGPGVRLREKAA
ncbi:transcriptional regulator [Phaeospirillum tilakii]|uniref:Transcriptional regulator n=1 Tax=Phaeospirillum tilakii TaxID=741673 RepID=A0ABW5CE02_9PROT